MKVNMTPNPLDVVTIHASQGDTEARQWEFELHNNGELIDTSDVKEQMVFKSYKGGTEQLLPENTSTPTTSPFKGDIRYPQGLLTDQEFTYRQSPTEEDGLAKITDIKGNTLVWNQLLNISVATSTVNGITYTINGDGSISISGTATATADKQIATNISYISGHKYLLTGGQSANLSSNTNAPQNWKNSIRTDRANGTIIECINSYAGTIFLSVTNGATINTRITPMLIDLTQMGLDITDPSDFASLFPLSYYSYNQGSLLSFMGNGLKTVGKNLYTTTYRETFTDNGVTFTYIGEGRYIANGTAINTAWLSLAIGASSFVHQINLPRGTYTFSTGTDKLNLYTYASSDLVIVTQGRAKTTIVDSPLYAVRMLISSGTVFNNTEIYMQIEYGNTATEYEPYTSSTLSLPISTYFPTGMKSAGNVCDELTESKAITRIGAVDLGTLTYTLSATAGEGSRFSVSANQISNIKPSEDNSTIMNAIFLYGKGVSQSNTYNNVQGVSVSSTGVLNIYIEDYKNYTVDQFKTAMSGVYLYYELATPTETSFTTASLVTENGEIPLSNNDGVLLSKCTEQLSENPGFIDAKIKLTDADGECYSNKIQLHVERSPQ